MANTTTLSTKGQIILPKPIRDARAWGPGTQIEVEDTKDGVVLRPVKHRFAPTQLESVAGMLHYKGKAKSIAEMKQAVADEVRRRHASGRY